MVLTVMQDQCSFLFGFFIFLNQNIYKRLFLTSKGLPHEKQYSIFQAYSQAINSFNHIFYQYKNRLRYLKMKQESDPKPTFRNTRSRFYKKKSMNQSHSEPKATQSSTGEYWKLKGNTQMSHGKIQEAIKCYTKAMELNPGESIYYSNRARCYLTLKKFKDALKDAQQACELEESNIKAHYICGCILAELGKTDSNKLFKAQNRLKKALRLCNSLKKEKFIDSISIKFYRVRKVQWFKEEENKMHVQKLQAQLLNNAYHEGIINRQNYEKMKESYETSRARKKQIPDYMLCKITLQLMEEPVTTIAGFSYEKSAIEDHIRVNGFVQPISRVVIPQNLYPNLGLKAAIKHFLDQNPWAFEFQEGESYENIQF